MMAMVKTLLVSVAPLLLVLGACGDDDTTSSETVASTEGEIPHLTYDGSDCVYTGPQEMPAGVVTVELVNDDDGIATVLVGLLEEDRTVQDYIDYISPEPHFGAPPPWLSDTEGQAPAKPGETMSWEAGLAAGEYVVACSSTAGFWFGTGLTVVDG